jgi:hypothetical protein
MEERVRSILPSSCSTGNCVTVRRCENLLRRRTFPLLGTRLTAQEEKDLVAFLRASERRRTDVADLWKHLPRLRLLVLLPKLRGLLPERGELTSLEMLRPRLLGIAMAVALAGCASLGAKDGIVAAGRVTLEPALDPETGRPILLPLPRPDLNGDAMQAIKERRPEHDALRESQLTRPALPGLGYDTTQGIQSQSLEKALGR